MKETIKEYFARIGATGGRKSRRALSADQARAMVKAREEKKKSNNKTPARRVDASEKTK